MTGKTKVMTLTTKIAYAMNTEITGEDMLIRDVFLMDRNRTRYLFNVTINNRGRTDNYGIQTLHISNRSWNINYTMDDKDAKSLNFTIKRGSSVNVQMILYSDEPITKSRENIEIRIRIDSDRTTLHREHEMVGVVP